MNLLTGGPLSGLPLPLNPNMASASMAAAAGVPPAQLRPARMAADLPPLSGSSDDKTDEDKHRAVVVKALKEIAEKEKRRNYERPLEEERNVEKATPSREAEDRDKKPRCFLHTKPNPKCKKCQAAMSQSSSKEKKEEQAAKELPDADEVMRRQRDDRSDKKVFQCSPMLKEQIMMSAYFKSLLEISGIDHLINEIIQYADTLDVYNPGSKTSPSCFMCHVFRLSTLSHIENELSLLIDNRDYAVVRCVGFLFIRFVTPPTQLWETLEEYLLDDMELIYAQDGAEVQTTIGEYVESLLIQDKYFDSPVPRLPVRVRQTIEEKVAPMLQYRKRMQANRRAIREDNVEDMAVEVCIDGRWHKGTAKELAGNVPSRVKVRVTLSDGKEMKAHLGKVIRVDKDSGADSDDSRETRRRRRSRSRSRGKRGRDVSPDWSRSKGKSDREMLQELRERAKESAVTSHGKSYAKRPLDFNASMSSTALPDPGLRPHDSDDRGGGRRRRISIEEEEAIQEAARRKQADDDERQRRLHNVYQKYCAAPSQSSGSAYAARARNEVDTPDVLRLG